MWKRQRSVVFPDTAEAEAGFYRRLMQGNLTPFQRGSAICFGFILLILSLSALLEFLQLLPFSLDMVALSALLGVVGTGVLFAAVRKGVAPWARVVVIVAAIGTMGAGGAIAYQHTRYEHSRSKWPEVSGAPTGTRVVQEPANRSFSLPMYRGECRVKYLAQGKEYTIWAASGFLSSDAKFIADRMEECPTSNFLVHYNPENPQDAVAERR